MKVTQKWAAWPWVVLFIQFTKNHIAITQTYEILFIRNIIRLEILDIFIEMMYTIRNESMEK